MSGVLRVWIAPVAEAELGDAARSLKGYYLPRKRLQKGRLTCHANILSIHMTKGKHVQIVDFNGQNVYPFHVTVSDGTTLIHASFDRDGTDSFAKQFGREFATIRGGIIVIEDYSLSFNPTATASQKLSLKVTKFKLHGSEGSKTFGQPSDILRIWGIQDILTQLNNLLSGTEHVLNARRESSSPILSQTGDLSDIYKPLSTGGATQADFATQVEKVVAKRGVPAVVPVNPLPTSYSSLLGLLRKDQKSKPETAEETSGNTSSKEASSSATNGPRKQPPLAAVPDHRIFEMTSKLEAKANQQQTESSKSTRSIRSSDPKSQPLSEKDHQYQTPPVVSISVFDDSGKENSQGRQQSPISDLTPDLRTSPIEQPRKRAKLTFVDQFQTGNPFVGLKRVPRKYLRISEAQQTILEGDSWFSHQTNNQIPCASIPANVKDDIVAFVDRQLIEQKGEVSDQDSDNSSKSEGNREQLDEIYEEADGEDVEFDEEGEKSDPSITGRPDRDVRFSIGKPDEPTMPRSSPLGEVKVDAQRPQSDENRRDFLEDADAKADASTCSRNCNEGTDLNRCGGFPLEFSQNLPHAANGSSPEPANPHLSRYQRLPVFIPSSSPTEEQELELAVPHAIGDLVEESDEDLNEDAKVSQELPSTAVENSRMVQVRQTPYVNPYALDRGDVHVEPADSSGNQTKHRFDEISSEPVIPATFHDASSQQPASSLDIGELEAESLSLAPFLVLEVSDQYSSSHLDDCMARGDSDQANEVGSSFAQRQLFAEYESSQCKPKTTFCSSPSSAIGQNSTPKLNPLSPARVVPPESTQPSPHSIHSPTPEPDIGESKAAADAPTHRYYYSPEVTSSPPYEPLSPVIDIDQSKPIPLGRPHTLKRSHEVLEEPIRMVSSKRRWRASAAAILTEDDCVLRDPKEMARASRHSFNDRFSKVASEKVELPTTGSRPSSPVLQVPSTLPLPASELVPVNLDETTNIVHSSAFDEDSHSYSVLEAPAGSSTNFRVGSSWGNYHSFAKLGRLTPQNLNMNTMDHVPMVQPGDGTLGPSHVGSQPEPPEPSYFDHFKSTYPEYEGDKTDFTKALVYIDRLRTGKKPIHRFLCDDFIRVYPREISRYFKPPLPRDAKLYSDGWEFYDKNVIQRVFEQELITPDNLQVALLSLDPGTVEQCRAFFTRQGQTMLKGGPQSTRSTSLAQFQQCHEGLKNSLTDTQPLVEARCASPELGVARTTLKTRQPFFETPSQLPRAKRNDAPTMPDDTPIASPTGSERKTKRPRSLSWSSSPCSTTVVRPDAQERARSRTSPSIQPDGIAPRSLKRSIHNVSQTPMSQSPSSPILGQEEGPLMETFKPVGRLASSTSHHRDALKSQSLPTSKITLRRVSNTSEDGADELRTVEGWLDGIKPPTFRDYIKNKALGGGLSSRTSTPSSTPVKRFSIIERSAS